MASWKRLIEVGAELGPDPELVEVSDEALTGLVRSQAAMVSRETARWIVLVSELVVRGVWAADGAKNPGQWLSLVVGMAPTTARDHVRVGLALRSLPQIREAFLAGQVSYSKVRAMTRLGHEETEELLLEWADAASAAELEQIISWTRRSCRIDGIEADPLAEDPTDESGADRDRLVVTVDAELIDTHDDSAESHQAGDRRGAALRLVPRRTAGEVPAMGVRTLRRLACSAGIVPIPTGGDSPLDVGRLQRRATPKQRRALALRDPGCRFPGCSSSRHLHVHHALEWDADDGPTDLDNLVHLCGFHHRFLHRAGWRMRPEGQGRFTFLDAQHIPFDVRFRDSAESPDLPVLTAAIDDGRGLQPRHWDEGPVDLDLCIAVLRRHLDRRPRPEPDLALAA